jgi:hypothetical protein
MYSHLYFYSGSLSLLQHRAYNQADLVRRSCNSKCAALNKKAILITITCPGGARMMPKHFRKSLAMEHHGGICAVVCLFPADQTSDMHTWASYMAAAPEHGLGMHMKRSRAMPCMDIT